MVMSDFWFYLQLGLQHVLDFSAYDHMLFLSAMTLPFAFRYWRKVLLLVTIFTLTHCIALIMSVFEITKVDAALIEFLIPLTILITAVFNILFAKKIQNERKLWTVVTATGFFGFIHGFGFSNYFKILVAGSEQKITPLLGFASGIELSQVFIVLLILGFTHLVQQLFGLKRSLYIILGSLIIAGITIPLLIATFPL